MKPGNGIERADLCVIGAGAGGLSVAAGAAQLGAKVVLVEKGEMGGDCLNHGCVPSKALLAAARAAHVAAGSARLGVRASPEIDHGAVHEHVRGAIAAIAPYDSQERFERLGVRVIRAPGRFVSRREIEAGGRRIRARRFVIATGSRPAIPPIPGLDEVPFETNETIFSRTSPPRHLLVLGGGPIGLEMAQAHARLGAAVTVIEAAPRIAPREEPELAAILAERLSAEGVRLLAGQRVVCVERNTGDPGGGIVLRLQDTDGQAATVSGSDLLVAVGRRPNVENLGLETAGIRTGPGGIETGPDLRTTNRRVFAIGDVGGRGGFTHLAGAHAALVIRAALFGLPGRMRDDHVPRVIFTDPELAHVGLTEEAARARHGRRLEVVHVPLADNNRSVCEGRREGRAKLMVVRGRPVGVAIVGPHAGEQIQPWALALARRMKLVDLAAMISPYPTFGESVKTIAGAWLGPRLFGSAWPRRIVRLVQRLP